MTDEYVSKTMWASNEARLRHLEETTRNHTDLVGSQSQRIGMLSERLDSHRKTIAKLQDDLAAHKGGVHGEDAFSDRLDKLEARVQVEEGRGAWVHPDINYRLGQVEEEIRKLHTRLTADEESQVAVQGDVIEKLAHLEKKVKRLEHNEHHHTWQDRDSIPVPWKWHGAFSSSPAVGEEHGVIAIRTTTGDVKLSTLEFLDVCRSYLRHRGEDV